MAIDLRWRSVSFYNDISLFPIVGSINILYVDRAAMLIYIWNGSSYEATEGGSGGSSITVVANYAALPDPTTVTASFYWCSASQGTAWLPGSLGGSYYNSGLYYSNGTSWEYMSSPYQAKQSEVDAGIISDKFVTPNTLYNSSKWGTKQNQITLTTTGSGAATFIADTLNIPTPAGGGGIFGISNSSGVYTYYATFTLAMAAATSGQTIEMFADVTETGAVTITLKNGVNINGNGHTYTLNNSGLTHALTVANTVATSCNINNLNVIRTGSTGTLFDNSCLILGTNGTGVINCSGSTFRNSGSGVGILFITNSLHEINFAVAYATTTWGAIAMFTSYGAKLNNSIGYGTSGGYGIRCHNGGDIQNCTGVSDSSYGIYGLAGNHSNSVGISTSGSGFYCAGNAYNCVGRSVSGIGLEGANSVNTVGCVGVSVSGIGISVNNLLLYNCTGISSSSRGVQILNNSKAYNLTSKSTSSYSVFSNSSSVQIYNSIVISEWNNAGGIGISSNNTTIPSTILNSTFLLSNASAPYLFNNTNAQAVSTRGNTYKGGGAYSVLITQAIVATEDTQGNIFL
jgi:hypothetical protein